MPENPLLNNRNVKFYVLIWTVISLGHDAILVSFYNIDSFWAVADSLTFNVLFAGMAISLWYTVRFLNIDNQSVTSVVLNHLGIAVVFLFVWFNTGYFLLDTINTLDAFYAEFHHNSLPWRVFCGVVYYCITVLVYYLQMYYVSFQQKEVNEAELKTLVKESELTLLKSQLNPHFIFNSLNSISSLTISNPIRAQDMLIKLSSFIRYALKQDKNELVSLEEEVTNCKLYLDIEKVRFGSKLIVEMEHSHECLKATIPNMILQPLLENAIKHGVYESLEPVVVSIKCELQNSILQIVITNNFDKDSTKQKGNGIGLRNVKQRLFLTYGMPDLVQISDVNNTFMVKLYIPQTNE